MNPTILVNHLLEDDSDEIDFDTLLANTPTMTPKEAYDNAYRTGRTAETDLAAAQDAEWAYYYADNILHGPFPAGEPTIATDPYWAYMYARMVLRGPFPAGESAIATDPVRALWYAQEILNGPFPAGEAAIATDPDIEAEYRDFLATL